MENKYTYGMIKPDAINNIYEIIKMIYDSGLEVHYMKFDNLSDEIIEENYSHCIGKDFYPMMKDNLQSGPVLKMLIYDPNGNAVSNYRKVLGATKSWEADENTIRGKFGSKTLAYKNAAHGSGNEKEANEEIIRFFKDDISMLLNEARLYTYNEAVQTTILSLNGTNYMDNDALINSQIRKAKKRYEKEI